MPQPNALESRETALQHAADSGGPEFFEAARAYITAYLQTNGPTPGELITDSAKEDGLRPKDDRAFGAAYASLSRAGVIRKHSYCQRTKGHLTSGGIVWELAE